MLSIQQKDSDQPGHPPSLISLHCPPEEHLEVLGPQDFKTRSMLNLISVFTEPKGHFVSFSSSNMSWQSLLTILHVSNFHSKSCLTCVEQIFNNKQACEEMIFGTEDISESWTFIKGCNKTKSRR